MLALTLVAVSVGLSNLAAAVGIGVGGVARRTRLRVGIIFGLFEAGMPVVGLLIGYGLASAIGHQTRWLAAALLVAVRGIAAVRGIGDRAARGKVGPPLAGRRAARTSWCGCWPADSR